MAAVISLKNLTDGHRVRWGAHHFSPKLVQNGAPEVDGGADGEAAPMRTNHKWCNHNAIGER